MLRPRRIALLLAGLACTLALAGCGNKHDVVKLAETEGIYIDVGELTYQVQISRILNPAFVEDQAYLRGVSEGVRPDADEVWYAIFMRVQNETDETHMAADRFEIVDTQENSFEPLNLDAKANAFAYKARELAPQGLIPTPSSPAYDNTIQGALLLYKISVDALANRPLELKVSNSANPDDEGVIDLDI